VLEEEKLGNTRLLFRKRPSHPGSRQQEYKCSQSYQAPDQSVTSNLMQIARPNQEVISADKRALQADVSNSGTSRPSRLNSIHQIIASSFISAVALPGQSLHVFLDQILHFGPVLLKAKYCLLGLPALLQSSRIKIHVPTTITLVLPNILSVSAYYSFFFSSSSLMLRNCTYTG